MYNVQSHFYDESALCDDIEHVLFRIMSLFYRDDCPFVTKYVVTYVPFPSMKTEKNTHKLCKENDKNERAEVSANSFVLAEPQKSVQQTSNKRLPLKYIAEQTTLLALCVR